MISVCLSCENTLLCPHMPQHRAQLCLSRMLRLSRVLVLGQAGSQLPGKSPSRLRMSFVAINQGLGLHMTSSSVRRKLPGWCIVE